MEFGRYANGFIHVHVLSQYVYTWDCGSVLVVSNREGHTESQSVEYEIEGDSRKSWLEVGGGLD